MNLLEVIQMKNIFHFGLATFVAAALLGNTPSAKAETPAVGPSVLTEVSRHQLIAVSDHCDHFIPFPLWTVATIAGSLICVLCVLTEEQQNKSSIPVPATG
jgi:hypothetical protein